MLETRVLIVDDQVIVRKGIVTVLRASPGVEIVGEAEDMQSAVDLANKLSPDVIVGDFMSCQGSGVSAIITIKSDHPQVKIVVLTLLEDTLSINTAIEAGADGYLLKDTDCETLSHAIQAVRRGGMPLSPRVAFHLFGALTAYPKSKKARCLTTREQKVLQLVTNGLSNKDIGQTLHLSEGTVKVHVSHILRKLRVSSRTEAAVWASKRGLVSLTEDGQELVDNLV